MLVVVVVVSVDLLVAVIVGLSDCQIAPEDSVNEAISGGSYYYYYYYFYYCYCYYSTAVT